MCVGTYIRIYLYDISIYQKILKNGTYVMKYGDDDVYILSTGALHG